MSFILRAILFLVVWVLFAFLTFTYCIEPECCSPRAEEEVIEEAITPAPAENDYAVATRLGDAAVLLGNQWLDLRDRLLAEYRADTSQLLEIYGAYYAGEPIPDGYGNLGLYRASLLRDLLVPDVPAAQILTLSRRLDPPIPAEGELWPAGIFNWKAAPREDAPAGVEIVEVEDEIIIRFPFNESTKKVATSVDEYLTKLAERLKQTEETVVITGHTDNVDTDAFNMRLGQKRADFVRDLLVRRGAEPTRITTRSEGESNPAATNDTAAGRQINRRAVVKLMAP